MYHAIALLRSFECRNNQRQARFGAYGEVYNSDDFARYDNQPCL
jgi:hypothetical protein